MPHSRRDSNLERKSELNQEPITSQLEQRQLVEHGEEKSESEIIVRDAPGALELDRPDVELNYQGNSLVIDMSRIEWIALAIIILSVASTIYLLR